MVTITHIHCWFSQTCHESIFHICQFVSHFSVLVINQSPHVSGSRILTLSVAEIFALFEMVAIGVNEMKFCGHTIPVNIIIQFAHAIRFHIDQLNVHKEVNQPIHAREIIVLIDRVFQLLE